MEMTYQQKWRLQNLEKVRRQAREWAQRQKLKDPIRWKRMRDERAKKYRLAHLEKYLERARNNARKRRLSNREEVNRQQREYRKKNPEKFKQYYLKNKDKKKPYARMKQLQKYGLTQETFNHLLNLQEGKCAICKSKFDGTPKIDHCHEDKKTRGLLCQECNLILGYTEKQIKKSIHILEEFTKYLKTHDCWEKH